MLGFIILLLIFIQLALGWYTNHGQKSELPSFKGLQYIDAKDLATKHKFELIIDDSVHIVGKIGGEILNQNPVAGSYVKDGRIIYITTTKYNADEFSSGRLPTLYGKKYSLKKKELERHFNIKVKIKSYKYDPGPTDHILEVYYKNELIVSPKGRNKNVFISKGDVLECVLSKRGGGKITVPDLKCRQYSAGKFYLNSLRLKVGIENRNGIIEDEESAFIVSQNPSAGSKTNMESIIKVTIQQIQPFDCP